LTELIRKTFFPTPAQRYSVISPVYRCRGEIMAKDGAFFFRSMVVCALSLSLGWGIRGNFGHAYGAMIPGVLAALAAVLLSGREDWWQRAGYFALFGALGWSFGGTISYMQVIAYTHSGHWPSQVYGFACLCVIGFLWGSLGGAGTALPACLDRERLTSLFAPILAVFVAWFLQDLVVPLLVPILPSGSRHESVLYWYDTCWIAALVAPAAVLVLAAVRWRLCWGSRFILHLAGGWWLAFLGMVLLVDGLGIEFRMTPPRGDNWAGALGMTAGAFVYFLRNGLAPVARAALVAGTFGGLGFAAATFLKLVEVKYVPLVLSHMFGESAWQTNWHSILEQTYGFINGIGIAVAMQPLARRLPRLRDEPRARRWTEVTAVAFVLLLLTYVNLVKNVSNWVQQGAVPGELYGLSARVWFNAGYAVLAVAVIALLARHVQQPLAVVPANPLGKAQLLYLVLLWWVVIGNLMRAIPPFAAQRLVTEGVIHLNAVCCTVLVLLWPTRLPRPDLDERPFTGWALWRVAAAGLLVLAVVTVVASYGTYAIHGSQFVGHGGYHVRFGPDALPPKPKKGEPHP
jgi:hypothetical protein